MAWLSRWLALTSRGWVLVGLALVNVVLIVLFGLRARLYAPPDAITLQLAFWPEVFRSVVVDQWGPDKAGEFVETVWQLDFLFPLAYASFLGGLYAWLSARLEAATWGPLLAAPWVAAAFDAIENLLQIHLVGQALAGGGSGAGFAAAVLATSLFAAVKWVLLVASVLGTVAVVLRSEAAFAIWTCRFGVLSVVFGSLPFLASSQGQDLLRILADEAVSTPQAAITYVSLVLWAASAWYWSRVLLQIRWREREPSGAGEVSPVWSRVASWLPRTLGTATLLLTAVAFAKAASGVPSELGGRLFVHAGGCLVLAIVFFVVVTHRRRLLGWPRDPLRVESWDTLPFTTRGLGWGCLAASGLMLVLFTFAPVATGWRLGALAIVFLAAANATFLGSVTVVTSRVYRIPVVVFALLGAAVFSGWNDNHALRLLEAPPPGRPALTAAFQTWAAPRLAAWTAAGKPGPMPVFLVAAEGGGIRAAYWAAVVLGRLEDEHPGFARQVFAISGVSGGSLGAAVFVALLQDGAPETRCRAYASEQGRAAAAGVGPLETCAQEVLRQDLLSPAVGKLVAPDFVQWFAPAPVPLLDRGRAIEDTWSAAYRRATGKDTLDQAFLSVAWSRATDEKPPEYLAQPALLLNGTHVHTGQRLLRAPFTWPNTLDSDPRKDQMPEVTDLTALLAADVRLATAAHDSARFAYVSPAGRLRSQTGRDFGHVVDGGYFENSGAATLADVLRVIEGSGQGELNAGSEAAPLAVWVLYLCNNPGRCYGTQVSPDPARLQRRDPGLGEVFAPIRALLGAREARGSLALAHLKQALGPRFLEFGVCSAPPEPPVPLGWQLSEGMRQILTAQAAGGKGAKGVTASGSCLAQALAGTSSEPVCAPPVRPGDGCS